MIGFDIVSYLRTLPRMQLPQLEDIECSVCHNNYLEENENGYVENAIILPCKYAFGKACIVSYFLALCLPIRLSNR